MALWPATQNSVSRSWKAKQIFAAWALPDDSSPAVVKMAAAMVYLSDFICHSS
jgi:hypothetical protein